MAALIVAVAGVVGFAAHTIGHDPNVLGELMVIPIWLGGIVYIVARIRARDAGGLAKPQMMFAGLVAYVLGIYLLTRLGAYLSLSRWHWVDYVLRAEPFLGDVFRCLIVALSWYAIVDVFVLVRAWTRRRARKTSNSPPQ